MGIVAGLDSSADGTTVVVCDADTGAVLRKGYAAHHTDAEPAAEGDRPARRGEANPQSWLLSLGEAARDGLLEGVQAIGVAAQQQGVIALDAGGVLVRPALLAGDLRAQLAAADLTEALGGPAGWAEAVGSVPRAGHPVTKLRWLAQHEAASARRIAEVLQPHDWLVWQLLDRPESRTTDRGDASGTGYWSAATGQYREDLVELALGHRLRLPRVLGPAEPAGHTPEGLLISAGTGETMATALGLGLEPGDAVVKLNSSGSVFAVHGEPLPDPAGAITSFADATGRHLPVVRLRNAVRVLRSTAELLDTDLEGLSELALTSTPGAHGLVLLPYLEGELVPALPHAAGTLAGLRGESMKREHLARAAFEGMLCGLADALDLLRERGVRVRRVFVLGRAGELPAVRELAPAIFGVPVVLPPAADHAALGAARQAAWSLRATEGTAPAHEPPHWSPTVLADARHLDPGDDLPAGGSVRQQYAAVRARTHPETGERG